jgi:hypothetical protein
VRFIEVDPGDAARSSGARASESAHRKRVQPA